MDILCVFLNSGCFYFQQYLQTINFDLEINIMLAYNTRTRSKFNLDHII